MTHREKPNHQADLCFMNKALNLARSGIVDDVPVGAIVVEAFSAIERDMIIRALAKHQGRVAETARSLDMSRITLWRKMKKYGMHRNNAFPA